VNWLEEKHKVMPVTDPRHWIIDGFRFEGCGFICRAHGTKQTKQQYLDELQPLLGMSFEQIYRRGVLLKKEQEETFKAKNEGRETTFDLVAANKDLDNILAGKSTLKIDFDGCYDPLNYDEKGQLTYCAPIKCTFK
jgi:hypothetical protein